MKYQSFRSIILSMSLLTMILVAGLPAIANRLMYELEGPFTWDTPMYWAVGRAWLEGKTLYLEMFENKPPIIFLLSALSYSLTADYYLLNLLSFIIHILMVIIPILVAIKLRGIQTHVLLLSASLGLFLGLYSFINSGYVQVEAFGSFFVMMYVLVMYFKRDQASIVIILIEGLFMMMATLTKEPFFLVIFAISLIVFNQRKQWLYHFFYPAIVGGILGIVLLIVTRSLSGYFVVYLPHMLGEHVDYYGSPFLRGLNVLRLIQDLEYHLKNVPSLFLLVCLFAFFESIVLTPQKNNPFSLQRAWMKLIRYSIALYLVSFAVGLGGQYYNHHFVFAIPLYFVFGIQLIFALTKPHTDALTDVYRQMLTSFFSLGMILNYLLIPPFVEALPLLQLQEQIRLHASFVDDVLAYYNLDTYQFIGFNGPQYYGHTESSPKGPVFYQDPRNFQEEDSWFVQQFLQQIETVDFILVHTVNLGVIEDDFLEYLNREFTIIRPSTLILNDLNPPLTFKDQMYLRKTLE